MGTLEFTNKQGRNINTKGVIANDALVNSSIEAINQLSVSKARIKAGIHNQPKI